MRGKLKILEKEAFFESTGYRRNFLTHIYPAVSYEGIFRLFKILITNRCQNNCLYCGIRAGRSCQRFFIKPKELANIFMQLYKTRKVDGLFVSSGIYKSPTYSQKLILDTVYILRKRFNFEGFIHAKVLPSADLNLVEGLSFLADRVSINLEVPKKEFLEKLCPEKNLEKGLLRHLKFLYYLNKKGVFKSGITSQLVVGADKEKDKQILEVSSTLYRNFNLRRVYYSGFVPIKDTPLENRDSTSFKRIYRLYQADVLLRNYGFKFGELFFDKEGNLPLDKDPKVYWAYLNKNLFPVNINKASLFLLKRIPGIGPRLSEKIVRLRKYWKFKTLEDLRKIGVNIKRAKNWVRFS